MAKSTHDPRYRQLIAALADARRDKRVSQVELAGWLGKRQQFVSKYESGERRIDAIELVDIARALDLDVAALLEGIQSPS